MYVLTESNTAKLKLIDNDISRSKAKSISITVEDDEQIKRANLDDDITVDIQVLDESLLPVQGIPIQWSISAEDDEEVIEFSSADLTSSDQGRAFAVFHTANKPSVYTVNIQADLENQDGELLTVEKRIVFSSAIDAREKATVIQIKPVVLEDITLNGLDKDVDVEIEVLDENSQPLVDVAVSWDIASNVDGESVVIVSEENMTDSNGRVKVVFHTAVKPRVYQLQVTVGDETLTLSLNSGIAVIAEPNTPESAIAVALDKLCTDLEVGSALLDRCNELAQAAVDGDNSGVLSALKAMAPEEVAAQMDMGSNLAFTQLGNIGQRLSALRRGAKGISLSGLSFGLRGETVSGQLLNYLMFDDMNGFSANDTNGGLLDNKLSFFASGHINTGERDATGLEKGFKFDSKGLTFGADYRATRNVVYGLALGYSKTDLGLTGDGSGLDANGNSLTAYGLLFSSPQSYVTGMMSVGVNKIDMTREVNFNLGAATPLIASGNTKNKNISVSLGGGYEFVHGESGLSSEINGRVDFIRASIDSYKETGANEFNLNIDEQLVDSLVFNVGGRMSLSISTRWAVILPYAGMSFEHSEESNHVISGYFLADPSQSSISFNTDKPDNNYFRLNTGITAVLPKGISLYVQYDTVVAKDLYSENNYSFGGRYEKQF
jgi:outer membrane autotransporter protein